MKVLLVLLVTSFVFGIRNIHQGNTMNKPKLRGSLSFAVNDPFTAKERCVLRVANLFKSKYLKYVVMRRAKRIADYYRLEKLRRKSFGYRRIWDPSRDLKVKKKLSNQDAYIRQHIRQFIKKMGKRMQIFGKVYSEKSVNNPEKLLRHIRHNWINALRVDTSNNKESILGSEIQNMLIHQFSLRKRYKTELEHCHLSVKPSLKRCEKMNGKGSCEVLYSGVVHKKCPSGLWRVGCCSCAPKCPDSHFVEDHYFCRPKQSYQLDVYVTETECVKEQGTCELYGDRYIGQCKNGFKKADDLPACQVECPKGWTGLQEKCLKPGIVSLGTPFVWIKSDD